MWMTLGMMFAHFFMPLSMIYIQQKRHYSSMVDWFIMALFVGSFCGLFFIAGLWHWFGAIFRYTLLLILVIGTALSFAKARSLPFWKAHNPREWFGVIFLGFMTILGLGLLFWSMQGRGLDRDYIKLHFPLKSGDFYVTEGGDAPIINSLHTFPDIARKFSVSLVQVGGIGNRATGINPLNAEDFYIFGQPVYSPAEGRIRAVVDSFPDVVGGNPDTSLLAEYGNRIEIVRGDTIICLAFLRQGSILKSVGDSISVGEPFGQVGCSGDATEPVLRMFAYLDRDNAPWGWGHGIPMVFGRAFLYRNAIIQAP